MMRPMAAAVLPDLGRHRVIVSLPAAPPEELVAACEVLLQEGLRAWSLPVGRLAELATLKAMFGRRARIGVHDLAEPLAAAAAAAGGADFGASVLVIAELVTGAGAMPMVLGGLTPNELRAGMQAGAAAVQVVPCEAFGSGYSRALPALMDGTPLIARGRLEVYQAELWLESGAAAVWPQDLVTADLVTGADLDELRRRCQQWRLGD